MAVSAMLHPTNTILPFEQEEATDRLPHAFMDGGEMVTDCVEGPCESVRLGR
jgi:hypothetical protein